MLLGMQFENIRMTVRTKGGRTTSRHAKVGRQTKEGGTTVESVKVSCRRKYRKITLEQ